MNVDQLLNGVEKEQFLKESGWHSDVEPDELEAIYENFRPEFNAWLQALSEKLGPLHLLRTLIQH